MLDIFETLFPLGEFTVNGAHAGVIKSDPVPDLTDKLSDLHGIQRSRTGESFGGTEKSLYVVGVEESIPDCFFASKYWRTKIDGTTIWGAYISLAEWPSVFTDPSAGLSFDNDLTPDWNGVSHPCSRKDALLRTLGATRLCGVNI